MDGIQWNQFGYWSVDPPPTKTDFIESVGSFISLPGGWYRMEIIWILELDPASAKNSVVSDIRIGSFTSLQSK